MLLTNRSVERIKEIMLFKDTIFFDLAFSLQIIDFLTWDHRAPCIEYNSQLLILELDVFGANILDLVLYVNLSLSLC